jgi:hypothetical protein
MLFILPVTLDCPCVIFFILLPKEGESSMECIEIGKTCCISHMQPSGEVAEAERSSTMNEAHLLSSGEGVDAQVRVEYLAKIDITHNRDNIHR